MSSEVEEYKLYNAWFRSRRNPNDLISFREWQRARREKQSREDKVPQVEEQGAQDTDKSTLRKGKGGTFFRIDRQMWSAVCDLGSINCAVSYLIMACGTGGSNVSTFWSAEAVHTRGGNISWHAARAAITLLEQNDFVVRDPDSKKSRPRYFFPSWLESDRRRRRKKSVGTDAEALFDRNLQGAHLTPTQQRKLVEAGFWREKDGRLTQYDELEPTPDGMQVWLPNELVNGAPGVEGLAPVAQLAMAGDLETLRLLIDLYWQHFLYPHQGVPGKFVRYEYDGKLLGQQGLFNVWGFKYKTGNFFPGEKDSPFARSRLLKMKAADGQSPLWDSLQKLERMGLIAFIPHLFPNGGAEAEPMHALAHSGYSGVLPEEVEIWRAASGAAAALLQDGQLVQAHADQFDLRVPVQHYQSEPVVRGILRLTFRPQTTATGKWYRLLKEYGPKWVEDYERIAKQGAKAVYPAREWEAWGT